MEKDSRNLHAKHRSRVKDRFLKEGLDSFHAHQIMEFLLFFGLPRQDTNEIAHRLINRFGSVSAVLDADFSELIKVEGVGEHCAILLKMIPQMSRIYLSDRYEQEVSRLSCDPVDDIGSRFVNRCIGMPPESLLLALLDRNRKVLGIEILSSENINQVAFTPSDIIAHVKRYQAMSAAVAHTHMCGHTVSGTDIDSSLRLKNALELLGVELFESYVISGTTYLPILNHHVGRLLG